MRTHWYVLGLLVGLTLAARGCGGKPQPTVHRLAMSETWDPKTRGFLHVAAWRRGDTIYVQTEGREPVAVYTDANLVGEPEIEESSSAMYAIAAQADGDEVLIRLEKDGSPRGPVYVFQNLVTAEQHCSGRQFHHAAITGIIGRLGDGGYAVQLSGYTSHGYQSNTAIVRTPTRPLECTIATLDSEVAVAIRFADHIALHFFTGYLAEVESPFELPTATGAGHISMAAGPASRKYALLHHGEDGGLRVTRLTAHGIMDSVALPRDVDASTADVAVNDRGLYVTWVSGRTLHARGLAPGARALTKRVARGSLTRTIGLWDACTIASFTARTNTVTFLRIEPCP